MKIVVLDGYALNSEVFSWKGLEAFGEVVVYDRTPTNLIIERLQGARIALTNKTPFNAATLDLLPELQYIGVLATGYNVVDTKAAAVRGVTVTNVPAYSTDSVAQHVFALLLDICNRISLHSEAVHQGDWVNSPDFSFTRSRLIELSGKTMGVVGFGETGQRTAMVAKALGMKLLATTSGRRAYPVQEGITFAPLEQLLAESDVVSLHCPLTPETDGLINQATLAMMKKGSILINTSRGPVVCEQDLADALNSGHLYGAGVDVLSTEPPKADNPLLTAQNCVITPHIAWATEEARTRLTNMAIANVKHYLDEQPINVVSVL
ncbi:MAG: D-2-hydroxyacid dehydrogenase [Gorillibacterium sp.]|nr:D-2-hydroxyacid dehydrogenase [Gorillibacterium sp.]